MVTEININGRRIGPGHPCLVIAEAGVNHNGSLESALKLVDVAAEADADAVKFQTFKADRLATTAAPKAAYQQRTTAPDESQLEMLRRLEFSESDHRALVERCDERRLLFMSTPFDEESADLLADLDLAVFKIPSGEITNLPLLAHVARLGRPMIVSTGMSNLGEVEAALDAIEAENNRQVVLLHCVSNYPADPADVNLRAMETLRAAFDVPVGYSDHTLGIEVSLAAVALGASVVEKHFTLDRSLPGPDHASSLEPAELADLVRGIRTVEQALGNRRKRAVASEQDTIRAARKSLVAARDIPAGSRLTEEMIAMRRPGTGLAPSMLSHLVGRTVREDVSAGTLFDLEKVA